MSWNKNSTATFHGFDTVHCSATRKYRSLSYESSFNHILLISIIKKINLTQQELFLEYKFEILIINTCYIIVHSTVYGFFIFGLMMAVTGRKELQNKICNKY